MNAPVKVRLLHVTTVPQTLGFLTRLVRFVKSQGFEVHALSSPGERLERFGREAEVPVHGVPMARRITPWRDLLAVWRITRIIRVVRPQIVHGHTPKGGLLAMLAAWLCGVPLRIYSDYVAQFYRAFARRDCRPSDLALFRRTVTDVRGFLLEQDLIYVGGGNTANMLAVWRVHGVDRILGEAWQSGIVLCGISAGAICWFEAGVTDSFGPELAPLRDGLGLLPGSACPHYDSEVNRRPTYRRLVEQGFPGGYAVDNGAALHFVNAKLHQVMSLRPEAAAYRVELFDGAVREERLVTRILSQVGLGR